MVYNDNADSGASLILESPAPGCYPSTKYPAAMTMPPYFIFIDRRVVEMEYFKYLYLLDHEMRHAMFMEINGLKNFTAIYYDLAANLLEHGALLGPGKGNEAKYCFDIAIDIHRKISLIFKNGDIVQEIYPLIYELRSPKSVSGTVYGFQKSVGIHRHHKDQKLGRREMRKKIEQYFTTPLKKRLEKEDSVHAKAFAMIDALSTKVGNNIDKILPLVFCAAAIDLSEIDFLGTPYPEFKRLFDSQPERFNQNFRLALLAEKGVTGLKDMPVSKSKTKNYGIFYDNMSREVINEHPTLPQSFKEKNGVLTNGWYLKENESFWPYPYMTPVGDLFVYMPFDIFEKSKGSMSTLERIRGVSQTLISRFFTTGSLFYALHGPKHIPLPLMTVFEYILELLKEEENMRYFIDEFFSCIEELVTDWEKMKTEDPELFQDCAPELFQDCANYLPFALFRK